MAVHPSFRLLEMRSSEIVLYAAASGLALLVDAGILTLLVTSAGWQYLPAAAVSFTAGGVFLYGASVRTVFRFRRIPNPALELPTFLALGLIGLVVNLAVIWILVEALHVHYLIGKAGASLCTFWTNFLLRRNVMFTRISESRAIK